MTEFLSSPHEVPDCPAPFSTSTQPSSEDKALHGARYELRLATYNCLSLKLAGQVDCIEEFCVGKQLHVVGLQETKVQWSGAAHSSHFLRVGSSANKQGLEGCQLWFRKGTHFGFRNSGESFGWDLSSCAVVYESARCLVVSAKAGGIEFVCVSVHAHTTSSNDSDVQGFWKFLSGVTSRFPPKAIRLFFLDANAHFDEWVRADAYYLPTNLNAQLLRDFAHAHGLVLSDLWSPSGEAIHTWISPQGHYRCLDFLAVPRHFQGCFQVQGSWDVLDRFAGLDHFMLGATLRFFLTDCRGDKGLERFDCGAMCTVEGQEKLCNIFQNMPQVHWSTHATQHWDTVCSYLQTSCRQAFPTCKQGPRKSHIDQQTWEWLGQQKNVRYKLRFKRQFFGKQVTFACFQAWRSLVNRRAHSYRDPAIGSNIADFYRNHNFSVARLWKQLRHIRQHVGQALKACQANRVRTCFAEARSQGPRAMAQLMASITKKGRRFKAPKMLPPLVDDNGDVITSKAAVLEKLGDFFAEAEKAQKMCRQDFERHVESTGPPEHDPWRAFEVPHVGELANALRKLKNGKAPGASGLPPELFSQAAQQAAMALFPLYLKGMLRHEFADGLLGAVVAAIPKPNKDPHLPSGWRSIALQECVAKAISSMFRGTLVRAFTCQADKAQLGGRPKGPIGVPAHLIQAHIRRMAALHRSAAVIFVDGAQAFYSVFREVIVGCDKDAVEANVLIRLVQTLSDDEIVQENLFKTLIGPTVLQTGGVEPAVQAYMQASLRNTFYQTDTESETVYRTLAGTVPGAPLADVLFQLAMTRFHSRVRVALAEANLQVQVRHPCTGAPLYSSVPAWVDDIAVPVEALQAQELIPKVVIAMGIVEEALRCIGVEVNFSRGKTEVLVVWRGENAKKLRQHWCIECCGRVEIPRRGKPSAWLHLVDRYVHLGSLMCSSGHVVADIRHRAAIARSSFKAVRDRLLRNPCLELAEKIRLVVQGPVASFLHGAGTWVMTNGRKGQAFKAFNGVLSGFMRSSLRPLLGWNPRGLTDVEVCLLLRVLCPSLTLVVARLRHLAGVAAWLDDYALAVLLEEATWLRAVAADLGELGRVVELAVDVPVSFEFDAWRKFLDQLATRRCAFRSSLRAAIKKWSQGEDFLRNKAAEKASCLTRLFDGGGVVWRMRGQLDVDSRVFECDLCKSCFSSKAALGSHRSRIHHVESAKLAIGDSTSCQRCGIEFWAEDRLWEHLRRRPDCLNVMLESDITFGTSNCKKISPSIMPATTFIGPRPFWATLRPLKSSQQATSKGFSLGPDHWQAVWSTYADRLRSSPNPKALSEFLRRFCQHEQWHATAEEVRHFQGSFGDICRIIHVGQGQMWGMEIISKGDTWAVCREGMKEVATSAILF